ncbi:hypothetical protein QYF48_22715 [Brevibacillus agri]|uniref:hypothetical protein n=1 Tax=Brevibacillus TaxID=55080 RepID=UPI00047DAAF2|nr:MULTISPECIES: hypothetical protein [Brevibacillus]MCG5252951.1 hypothetical protein [Brevibacillus agri]MDN4095603.1 hypothetical protein [Brevibacillus agri]QHZ58440.1 hypothetical protein M655_023920 [Brevibacillus sp. NSP2.1]
MTIISNWFVVLSLLTGLFGQQGEELRRTVITSVSTDLPKEGNWWQVPKGVKQMTIKVEAKNAETVLFWVIPTGTQMWKERELIGYDKDGSDGCSITWKFGDRKFHDHIHVQALGDETISNEIINVTSDYP